jgi:poly(3-hydroxybutyrate) depolymerase
MSIKRRLGPGRRLLLGFITLLAGIAPSLAQVQPLPALNIDIHQTSISGISSGGFMAVQFQVAHSDIVKGAGIVAAGPYGCAQGSALTATTRCSCTLDPSNKLCQVSATSTDVDQLVKATREAAQQKLIDNPANLARHRVLTYSGSVDAIVPRPVVAQLGDYYRKLGVPAANLNEKQREGAGHTMPTQDYGKACNVSESPYLGKCKEDVAKEILEWIYGPLQSRKAGTAPGKLIKFDQTPFRPSGLFAALGSGLDSSGWVYVPEACAKGQPCRLHIALHGCKQGQSYFSLTLPPRGSLYYGTTFVEHSGYNAWADANRLVVLYPQAVSVFFQGMNPKGCWDWWGYTDGHYADQQGVQIRALHAMVKQLSSGAK